MLTQWLVVVSPQLAALSVGGAVSFPAVLLHQLRSEALPLDAHTASWIGSIHGLAGAPSVLMPCLMQWRGRRVAFVGACLVLAAGWALAAAAPSAALLLAGESLHGLAANSLLAVSMLSISEMVSPDHKNVCMVSYLVVQTFAMGLTNVLARFVPWRWVGAGMCAPALCAAALGCAWPESPAWLAWRGRVDQCRRAHRRLRGRHSRALLELQELLDRAGPSSPSSDPLAPSAPAPRPPRVPLLPFVHMFLLLQLTYWSGGLVTLIYSEQIVECLTGDAYIASYAPIAVNVLNFVSVTASTVLLRQWRNKPVIVCSGAGTAACLAWGAGSRSVWAVGGVAAAAGLGLTSAVFSVAAELVPVRARGVGGALFVLATCALHASSLKAAPHLLVALGAQYTLLLFAANAALCTALVARFVPETKGKTLAQLEDLYTK